MTKKEKIESTAKELFWKYGFKKVSIDEICKKASVSRKTYYVYYSNKTSLIMNILDSITDEMFGRYEELIQLDKLSFSEKLHQMLLLKSEMNKGFSMEFVSDLYQSDLPEVKEYFYSIKEKSLSITRNFFTNAQIKGEMNPDLNIDFVMWYMEKQIELANAPEIKHFFTDTKSMTTQFSELIIYGVMPVNI